MPAACSFSGRLSTRNASITMSCVADAVATMSAATMRSPGPSFGSQNASSAIATISRICENTSQPRRRPSRRGGGGARRVHGQWWRERPGDVADLGLLRAMRRHLHLINRRGAVVGGKVLLKAHGAGTDVGLHGVDAGRVGEPPVDVGDNARRV